MGEGGEEGWETRDRGTLSEPSLETLPADRHGRSAPRVSRLAPRSEQCPSRAGDPSAAAVLAAVLRST